MSGTATAERRRGTRQRQTYHKDDAKKLKDLRKVLEDLTDAAANMQLENYGLRLRLAEANEAYRKLASESASALEKAIDYLRK